MLVVALSLVLAGVLLARIGRQSSDDRLPRNRIAGLRTRATMASDEAWYAAQRAGAHLTYTAGIVSVIGGLAVGAFFTSTAIAAVMALGTTAIMLGLIVTAGVKGQQAAKAVNTA